MKHPVTALTYLTLALALALTLPAAARADDAQACQAAAGVYRSGIVVGGPKFKHGQFRRGVELSHTHLRLKADQDGQVYDVAIDNVFADGYVAGQRGVPDALKQIQVNDRLALCGQLYTHGGPGIHWVHTNCGQRPKPSHPDGWIKKVGANGKEGNNIEGNSQYCSLF
jgi:hypothetical protein